MNTQHSNGDEWLQAIEDSTACLRHRDDDERTEICLQFLFKMEFVLSQMSRERWDSPPPRTPPSWDAFVRENSAGSGATAESTRENGYGGRSTRPQTRQGVPGVRENLFANFYNYDDDDDSDEEEIPLPSHENDDDEAGDRLFLGDGRVGRGGMDVRRVLIRVLTSQSEAFASIAARLRRSRQWRLGAEQYSSALGKIHAAIALADEEISRWMTVSQDIRMDGSGNGDGKLTNLREDADTVEVSVQSLTSAREHFLEAAQRQEENLVRRLTPQWDSRDEVRERMGAERWENNPRPKRDYARMREQAERELRDIRGALECLREMDMDQVGEISRTMKGKLYGREAAAEAQRCNGRRPGPESLARRVDFGEYPEPSEFGWEFTGSSGVTEFFERDGIKLDWYFTTATVKTSMDHPVQGRTQLFGARVDPDTYRAILENPRAHTGQRYQKRSGRRRSHRKHKRGPRKS